MDRCLIVAACALMLVAVAVRAAPTPATSLAEQANAAYQAKDWAQARTLYERLSREQPESAVIWLRLGISTQATGAHDRALEAYAKAEAAGMPPMTTQYRVAIAWASKGQTEKAFAALGTAVKQGFNKPDVLASGDDLRTLRGDPRFAALVERATHNQQPCAYQKEYQQFDFWLGDWDVVSTKELTPAGVSHIERAIAGCVIWENWTSLGEAGYFGKSYNTYNPDYKRWEQFWVDNQGQMIHFHGGLVDGVMDYYTDVVPQVDGSSLQRRLQFFNLGPDKVRQFGQLSKDGGATFSPEYDRRK
jgi:tetratricopeptide (TPR) repeat protein